MTPDPVPHVPGGNPHRIGVELPADAAYLVIACKLVCAFASVHGLDARDCQRLELAVDEVCTNCVTHAYDRDTSKRYRIEVERSPDDFLVIRVFDSGKGFQMSCVPVPDTKCALLERQIGGLGLLFAQKATDEFAAYRTPAGENCVEMKKRLSPAVQPARA